jgi:peptide deformylase
MIYPIVAYGNPILRQKAVNVEYGTNLKQLVADMFATMDQADGIGLAAPQIAKSIRLFVADLSPFMQDSQEMPNLRRAYINPILHLNDTKALEYREEGCLSIPNTIVNVPRNKQLIVEYFDINWELQQEALEDMAARVIQHEYDHLEGKLHIDYADPLERELLDDKLNDISQGKITVHYSMWFPNRQRK